MNWQQHIERVPGVMLGKPIFRNTRITVEFVLERLADGARPEDLVRSYPPLTLEHVNAALSYALSVVRQDELLESAPVKFLADAHISVEMIALLRELGTIALTHRRFRRECLMSTS